MLALWRTPCVAVGLVKAIMSAADKWMLAGKVKLFNSSDLASLKGTRHEAVMKAHALELEFRDLGLSIGVHTSASVKHHLGTLDVKRCMLVLQHNDM